MNGGAESQEQTFLNITFEGLCLFGIDRRAKSATVHFIDGNKAGIGEHVVVLETQTPHLVTTTLEPAPSHVVHVAPTTGAWVAPSGFGTITGPFDSGAGALRLGNSNGDRRAAAAPGASSLKEQLSPADSAWQSLDFLANLNDLCGATQVRADASFLGQMRLTRGNLYGRPPTGEGGTVEWVFEDPKTKRQIARQVITDTILHSCPIDGDTATISLGGRELVLQRVAEFGPAISLFIRSVSAHPQTHAIRVTGSTPLILRDFKAYSRVVNASFDPTVTSTPLPPPAGATGRFVGRQGGDVQPFYCNPAGLFRAVP